MVRNMVTLWVDHGLSYLDVGVDVLLPEIPDGPVNSLLELVCLTLEDARVLHLPRRDEDFLHVEVHSKSWLPTL